MHILHRHYCCCQSLHHIRCPLASPCPVMLRWTPWCCFHKLSGHICRSLQRSPVLFGVSAVVFPLIYGMQSRENLLALIFLQTAFIWEIMMIYSAFFSYESDCLGLMEGDNATIRSVESYAVEMDAGQERHFKSCVFPYLHCSSCLLSWQNS